MLHTEITPRVPRTLTTLFLMTALVGCGGGGSSGDSTSTSTSSSTPSPSPSPAPADVISSSGNLQMTATASAYGSGTDGDTFYTDLNTARLAAGAGAVNENTALDTASQAHALYEATNVLTEGVSHVEVSTSTNYYAATFTDRDTKAGYGSYSVGTEVIGAAGTLAYGLLATAYHGAALLSNATDVGFGSSTYTYGDIGVSDLQAPASLPYGQVAASGSFITYPYSGQTNVQGTFYVSNEVPRVSTTLLPDATAGAPVIVNIQNADYVNFNAAGTLAPAVTSFTLTDASGNAVPAVIIANSAITGATGVTVNADTELGTGFVELIATSPLTSGVTYTASFSATLKTGGTALSKTWSFLVQ